MPVHLTLKDMRSFLSINPGKDTQNKIASIQQLVKKEIASINDRFNDSIKCEHTDKFHMTLFFIGEIDEAKKTDIHRSMSVLAKNLSFNKIEFNSTGVNAFPKLRFPRVITLEFEDKELNLKELYEKINLNMKVLGFVSDKLFKPHITLGRVRRDHKINLTELEGKINIPINFTVNRFCLMKSTLNNTGSVYEVIGEYEMRDVRRET